MIASIREEYNRRFTEATYQAFLQDITTTHGYTVPFRISESPLFLDSSVKNKLIQATESIVDEIVKKDFRTKMNGAIPPNLMVPNEVLHPHFIAFDFALVKNERNEIVPQLIEMQGFPSLYAFQLVLSDFYKKHFYCPDNWSSLFGLSTAEYIALVRKIMMGNQDPENVVLLEIEPEKQNTAIDFILTEKLFGVKAIHIGDVKKSGRDLYYLRDGKKIPIHRIYNRVIFDELVKRDDLKLDFSLVEDVNVEWAGHPNWFFLISKYTMPFLKNEFIPSCQFLHDVKSLPENLADYVLKPLYSFSGKGVLYHVTKEDIAAIPPNDRHHFLLQKKVQYEPVLRAPDGSVKAEIRMLYVWEDDKPRPQLVTNLVRLSRGEMIGVRYNKDKTWVGASSAFFQP